MRTSRSLRSSGRRAIALVLVAGVVGGLSARADEPAEGDLGSSYTEAELALLDRVLHAGNLTRRDLTFQKDMAQGHGCFAVVREMLENPLRIAPEMDRIVARLAEPHRDFRASYAGLLAAAPLLVEDAAMLPERVRTVPTPRFEGTTSTPEEALLRLEQLAKDGNAAAQAALPELEALDLAALRRELPGQMAWHEVFASPYESEFDRVIDAHVAAWSDERVHELASEIGTPALLDAWLGVFVQAIHWVDRIAAGGFEGDVPVVRETPYGRVAIGTRGDDVYEGGDYAILIDPGGNDRYVGCRIGAAEGTSSRRCAFFVDLSGDDVYQCGDVDVTLGAAVLGLAAFLDLGQGDDRYAGGHASLGAAMGGAALFYDQGGSDVYEGKTFTQGAAGFGVAVFHDAGRGEEPEVSSDEGTADPVDFGRFDNDRLYAWSNSQAFARCRGVAISVNERGNDLYQAGGVYLHAPLFSDRYQSFSQGFAIGQRNLDYAGGIALLVDQAGNDRYLGDIYDQGVGYWYGAGLLYDGGGNDTYEMTQYGQGSGIHLAVGGLIDVEGHDTYVMHAGLGQGGSHDYAASILHDRGGNDRYHGSTSCNGSGLTNSVGIQIDRAGDDTYAGRLKSGVNFGRPARGFSSIGLLLDLEGEDAYLGPAPMEDGALWRHADRGLGGDLASEQDEGIGGVTPAADRASPDVEVPEICSYEGDLTAEVFDELWALATRWEVGDNRRIVPEAQKRLVEFGTPLLPFLDGKVEEGTGGLALRAYVQVLKGLRDGGAGSGVADLLRRNLESSVEARRKVALHLVGELRAEELAPSVRGVLVGKDEALARRAAGVLAKLESHAGDEVLRGWLTRPDADERSTRAALSVLLGLESDAYGEARPLLDHPLVSVRATLSTLLAKHFAVYGAYVGEDLRADASPPRARRTLLDVLARAKQVPSRPTVDAVIRLLDREDWGLRGDAARVIRHWSSLDVAAEGTAEAVRASVEALEARLQSETDPFVLSAGRAR